METEIEIRNLSKTYDGKVKALCGVNLSIPKGKIFALLGPNGAGKTTLVSILTMLCKQDNGDFSFSGIDSHRKTRDIFKSVGVASQDNELDPKIKTEELIIFQARLFGMSKNEAVKRSQTLINDFGLTPYKDKKTETLSGGNKRRLHCALALVNNPSLLFLDEPTVGMDPMARKNFWDTVGEINRQRNLTIFLTTQYLEEADKYAHNLALLIDGTIHYEGSVANFKKKVIPHKESSLEESYLEYVKSHSERQIEISKKEEIQ
jgi:ABC-2 type transport system ATP-binding protein